MNKLSAVRYGDYALAFINDEISHCVNIRDFLSGSLAVKPMSGILGQYFYISENGIPFSKRTLRPIKTRLDHNGYPVFTTRLEGRIGKSLYVRVHVQVARAFIPNPRLLPFVNHKDGVKTNPHKDNLEWCTAKENSEHAIKAGLLTFKRGFEHSSTVLTEDLVKEIFQYKGTLSNRKIGKRLGISRQVVDRVFKDPLFREYATPLETK